MDGHYTVTYCMRMERHSAVGKGKDGQPSLRTYFLKEQRARSFSSQRSMCVCLCVQVRVYLCFLLEVSWSWGLQLLFLFFMLASCSICSCVSTKQHIWKGLPSSLPLLFRWCPCVCTCTWCVCAFGFQLLLISGHDWKGYGTSRYLD